LPYLNYFWNQHVADAKTQHEAKQNLVGISLHGAVGGKF